MRPPLVQTSPQIHRINVTPIIDVALVLVIILLVTAPLLSVADLDITLPAARTRGAEDHLNINVTLSRQGELAIDEDVVSTSAFQGALMQTLADPAREGALVVVRADQSLPHALVRGVLDDAKAAGAKRIAIATTQMVEAAR